MSLKKILSNSKIILTEGGMIERIKRNENAQVDTQIAHSAMVYDRKGREILRKIYSGYIDVGKKYNCPVLSLAPTWRANPERIEKSAFKNKKKEINRDCVDFLNEIRNSYPDFSDSIFIGGMMACKGNAYDSREALSKNAAKSFHQEQAGYLAESNIDFIKAATLPALSEALGMAATISKFNIPYILSFVVKPDGSLLDGTPIYKAIETIDAEVDPKPLLYMVNCVHPTIFEKAIGEEAKKFPGILNRILGFQANSSSKSPAELDNLSYLDTTSPEEFADLMYSIHKKFGIKILGGCCGTDDSHIEALAEKLFNKK
ncbi:MAG: homocysteine S-methyltransferase family protein [Bacteroidales bacterium]|nr:homocysteine S-methyltransferase family protein [Bacteroidales bacterium]